MPTKTQKEITLSDENYFEFLNGLWKGEKTPLKKAAIIRNTNFSNDGKIDYSDIAVLDVEANKLESRKLRPGDIILERSGGGPTQPVGRVVYFERANEDIDYSFSNFTSTIRVKQNQVVDSKFLFYFLFNFYKEGRTDNLQRRTTGIRNLDLSAYKESIVLPNLSLDKQKNISQKLTTIQNAISAQEVLIAQLKNLKRSMMKHLFIHGIKGGKTRESEIGVIPESWEVVELRDVCERRNELYTPRGLGEKFYVGLEHIESGELKIHSHGSESEVKSSKVIFRKGDILYGKLRPYLDKAALADFDGVASTDIIILNGKNISNSFLVSLLHTEEFMKYAQQTTSGVNHPRTSWKSLQDFKFALPSKSEQLIIESVLWSIESKIEIAKSKFHCYQNIFKTLLHELMNSVEHESNN